MARYKPEVGDAINFQSQGSRKEGMKIHHGIVNWIASSGKFLTVYPHNVIINRYDGTALDMSVMVSIENITGKVKSM